METDMSRLNVPESSAVEPPTQASPAAAPPPASTWKERLAKRWGGPKLDRLFRDRLAILSELRSIPDRMQRVTNQARLVMELADDFRAGRYREISWISIAIAAASLVYAVSPGDVVPDVIPGIGALDDMVVLTLAMRLIAKDLRAYAEFKGYRLEDYF
jgi:uncharacterized membrane protein YkvA (DUF1232 family)